MIGLAYRRGFKTQANEIAKEVRMDLGLRPVDPLDPWQLASWLEIPIITLSSLRREIPAAVQCLSTREQSAFSAATVFRGSRRVIVHNDSHAVARQVSNLAHELAHGLLLHPPTPALDDRGCRDWDQDIEDEASWLAGVVLVPEEAAITVVKRGLSLQTAAEEYGVSKSMMQYRINVTGAHTRVARAKRVYK